MSRFCFNLPLIGAVLVPALASAAVSIGAPSDINTPYKFNKNKVLINFKVIECYIKDTKIKVIDAQRQQKHVACGDDGARTLMNEKIKLKAGKEVQRNTHKTITSFATVPATGLKNGSYQLTPEPKARTFENNIMARLYLSEWSAGEISFSVHVDATDHQTAGTSIARTSTGKVFTNPTPNVRHRVMVADITLKPGESNVFSGDVWVSQTEDNEILERLPATGRLWVEVEALQP